MKEENSMKESMAASLYFNDISLIYKFYCIFNILQFASVLYIYVSTLVLMANCNTHFWDVVHIAEDSCDQLIVIIIYLMYGKFV